MKSQSSATPIRSRCIYAIIFSDQLVFYFEKIKHENKRISPAHYMGQIKTMTNWMQSCIKVSMSLF